MAFSLNDLLSKIKGKNLSIDERFDEDIDKHTNVEHWLRGLGVTLTFGTEDDNKVLNKIMAILYKLATLKDHLKNCMKTNGFDPLFCSY